MRIGLFSARFLGEAVANLIVAAGHELVARHHVAAGWWGVAGEEHRDDVFAAAPELVVSVLTDHIFTADEIAQPECGIVNLHPAPLPEYRGCNSYSHAILNDDFVYRVTLHRVDAGIDTGPIIDDASMTLLQHDTARSLHDRAQAFALMVFAKNLHIITRHAYSLRAQDESKARYYRRDSLEPYRNLADHPEGEWPRIRRALNFPPFPMPE